MIEVCVHRSRNHNGYKITFRKPPSKYHNTGTTFLKSQVIHIYRVLRTIDYTYLHYIIGYKNILKIRIEVSRPESIP